MPSRTYLTAKTQSVFGDKTRGKILKQSLALFNQYGYDRVTTAQIAKVTSILEGTLWYHFNTKQALVLEHLTALETRLDDHLRKPIPEPLPLILEDLEEVFMLLWDFRYVLSDNLQQIVGAGTDTPRLRNVYVSVEAMVQQRLLQAQSFDLLNLEGVNIESLATSCVMIGRYWIDYVTVRDAGPKTPDMVRLEGMAQFISVLQPYLTEKSLRFQAQNLAKS